MSNKSLIQYLRDSGIIKSLSVFNAMNAVDRGNYVPSNRHAYEDSPVYIGHGQTISAPHMHAIALEYLLSTLSIPSAKVLDIGCGSGYLAAVMARLNPSSKVFGIEYVGDLVITAINNVNKEDGDLLQSGRLTILKGDGWKGLPNEAPFDSIHIGAAASSIPLCTVMQLKVGGMMVVPVGDTGDVQSLLLVERRSDGENISNDFTIKELMNVVYVPLVKSGRD